MGCVARSQSQAAWEEEAFRTADRMLHLGVCLRVAMQPAYELVELVCILTSDSTFPGQHLGVKRTESCGTCCSSCWGCSWERPAAEAAPAQRLSTRPEARRRHGSEQQPAALRPGPGLPAGDRVCSRGWICVLQAFPILLRGSPRLSVGAMVCNWRSLRRS